MASDDTPLTTEGLSGPAAEWADRVRQRLEHPPAEETAGRQIAAAADLARRAFPVVAPESRFARMKRRAIPDECFRDAGLMSRWIDANR